jgi:hypothetical protein
VVAPGEGVVASRKPSPGVALSSLRQQEGSRALAYGLREVSRLLLLSPYVTVFCEEFRGHVSCGTPLVDVRPYVVVALHDDPEGPRVGFHGIATCDSPWICPVCSPKLADHRGEALARTLSHFMSLGFRVAHAVLTVRHTRGMPLDEVFRALNDAWRHMTKDRAFRPYWQGLGFARGVEVTLGPNGWHPHIHVALVIPPERDPYALKEALWKAWSSAVLEVGWLPSDRAAYSFTLVESDADVHEVGRYVSKTSSGWGVGPEVTGGVRKDSKGGLSPFTLLGAAWWGYLEDPGSMASWFPEGKDDLDDPYPWVPGARKLAGEGSLILREFCRASFLRAKSLGVSPQEAARRWVEFAEATKGRKALTMSRSLVPVFRWKLAEVRAQFAGRVPVEVVRIARHVYLYLLHRGRLAYLVHLAESLGSLRLACELMGLVEGTEWFVLLPRANAPPPEEGVFAA